MKNFKRVLTLLIVLAFVLGLLGLVACDKKGGDAKADPKKATATCSKDDAANKDSDACKACCTKNGSNSHMWMTGKGCKCHVEF